MEDFDLVKSETTEGEATENGPSNISGCTERLTS